MLAPAQIQSLVCIHNHSDLIPLRIVRRFRAGVYTTLSSILLRLTTSQIYSALGPMSALPLWLVTSPSTCDVQPTLRPASASNAMAPSMIWSLVPLASCVRLRTSYLRRPDRSPWSLPLLCWRTLRMSLLPAPWLDPLDYWIPGSTRAEAQQSLTVIKPSLTLLGPNNTIGPKV